MANIGKNITPKNYTLSQKQELTDLLRDTLATLKWEIWGSQPQESRRELPDGYIHQYSQGFTNQITDESYSLEAIEQTRFHSKEEKAQKSAFAHLDMMIPSKDNAFLFRR